MIQLSVTFVVCSYIKMIRSPYTPVSIPDIAVHDEMFLACNANADKTALVSKILLIEGQLLLVTIVKHI